MKKTLLLTHEYYPYHGGVANYCYGLFSHLADPNYLIATDQKIDSQGDKVQTIKLLGRLIRPRWLLGWRNVTALVKKEKIEIILTPHVLPLGLIAEKIHQRHKIPYILSLHGLDIKFALTNKPKAFPKLLNEAKHIIVNSETTKKLITDLVPPDKLTVITPYYDEQMRTNENFQALKDKYQGQTIILTTGRLVARKNHYAVIEALHALSQENIKYLIVGSGPQLSDLKRLVHDLQLDNQVEFLTTVSDNELPNYYAVADIFVLPVLNQGNDVEGYGLVYLEAAHFSLPIIASRGTSAEEIIKHNDNGLLVDGAAPEQLTETLGYLINNPTERTRLGQAAHKFLATLPNWTDKAKVLSSLLS